MLGAGCWMVFSQFLIVRSRVMAGDKEGFVLVMEGLGSGHLR